MNIKIVCFDFDGVLHAYRGWHDEGYVIIDDPPVAGAREAIRMLRDSGCMVLVHSTRCGFSGGVLAVTAWLDKHDIKVDGVCHNKPPADVYVDDKAVCFRNNWDATLKAVAEFKPWTEKIKE